MTQYERKVSTVDDKWKAEVETYKSTVQQWKDKFQSESNSRHMLDENLRILGRRINDLEIDISDKKDAVEKLETEKFDLSERLASA
jgi:predicted RNase H-like nuclease (RuvC/YqgF family)